MRLQGLCIKIAAVRYAASCGKSQRATAKDLGLSDGTFGDWTRDAQPDSAGIVDASRFDELAQLRTQNRELLARTARLTQERDFLKKSGLLRDPDKPDRRFKVIHDQLEQFEVVTYPYAVRHSDKYLQAIPSTLLD